MPLTCPRFRNNMRLQKASDNSPPLKKGEPKGEGVEVLQQALIDLGFAMPISTRVSGLPDGIFGNETEAAVKSFQQRNGLSGDGVAGRDTLGRMDLIFNQLEQAERLKLLAEAQFEPPAGKWHMS